MTIDKAGRPPTPCPALVYRSPLDSTLPPAAMPRTAAKTASSTPARPRPVVKFRLRITAGDAIAIGPGKIDLLEAIAEAGSITAGAKAIGMSYRRAWLLVSELNESLKSPALDSAKGGTHGGGSELTEVGRALIDAYRRVQATAASACAADIKTLTGLLAR